MNKINKLTIVNLFFGASLLQACPQASPSDAGATDAGLSDAAQMDSAQEQDAGQDAGCAQDCILDDGTALSVEGTCDGTLLRYCENNCLVERDCAGMAGGPYSCGLYGPFYECLAGAGQDCEPNYWDCDPATNCNGQQPCDENAGLYCEERGASFLCVHAEMEDAGPGLEDATSADVNTVDAMISDAGQDDAQIADANTLDSAVEDGRVYDANLEDTSAPIEDAAHSEDSGLIEDAGVEDAAALEDVGNEDLS